MADPCPPDLNPASTHYSPSAQEPCLPHGQVISFAPEWDDQALRAPLDVGITDPAAGLALARAAWAAAPHGSESSRRPRAGLVLGLALNRAERYAEALGTLQQIHTALRSPALSSERAVCQWQIGVAARFLRADREFVQPLEAAVEALLAEGLEVEAARCRRDLAAAHNWRGDYAASEGQTSQARAFFERRGLRADAAACAFPESARLRWAGRFEAAHGVLAEAEAVFEGAGLPVERATAWLYQGSVHVARMGFDRADPLLQQAQAELERLGLPARLMLCRNEMGSIALHRGHLADAAAEYGVNLAASIAMRLPADQALATLNLASVRYYQGELRSALAMYAEASELYARAGDRQHAALSELNAGACERALGRYAAALNRLERARREREAMGTPVPLAHHNLGLTWLAIGDTRTAIQHFDQAIQLYRAQGADFPAARSLVQKALARTLSGEGDSALDDLQEARRVAARAGAPGFLALCDQAMGEIQAQAHQHSPALALFRSAEMEFEALGMPINAIDCRIAQADCHRRLGEAESARAIYRRSWAVTEAPLPDLAWRCAAGLAQLEEGAGRPDAALPFHARAVNALRRARLAIGNEALMEPFLVRRFDALGRAIRSALAVDQTETALAFVEESRSQLLGSKLAASIRPAREEPADHRARRLELAELRRRLAAEVDSGWSMLRLPSPEARELLAELERKAQAYQRLHVSTEADGGEPAGFDLAELRRKLSLAAPDGWACLAYFWLGGSLLIFALNETSVQVVEREPGPIEALALELCASPEPDRRRVIFGGQRAGQVYLQRLHQFLIPRAIRANLSPEKPLIIVPAGSMHALPFHALVEDGAALVERTAVVYAPSLAGLGHCLDRAASFSPEGASALVLSLEEFGEGLPPLPHAGREAKAVASFFRTPKLLHGPSATRQAFLDYAETHSARAHWSIHFATHAVFEARHGRLSRLFLHDEALHADEIERLPLRARLATLSACRSGLGQTHQGEETVGLVQSFFAGGIPSVLAAFFTVNDSRASDFMFAFYQNWMSKRHSPALALACAQREWIAAGRPASQWAAFGLFGAP